MNSAQCKKALIDRIIENEGVFHRGLGDKEDEQCLPGTVRSLAYAALRMYERLRELGEIEDDLPKDSIPGPSLTPEELRTDPLLRQLLWENVKWSGPDLKQYNKIELMKLLRAHCNVDLANAKGFVEEVLE